MSATPPLKDTKSKVAFLSQKPSLHRYPSKGSLIQAQMKEGKFSDSTQDLLQQQQVTKSTKLWELMSTYLENDVPAIEQQISDHMEYTLARDRGQFDQLGAYQATAHSVRDRLLEYWNDTNFRFGELNAKQVYYLSIEFLLGRTLQNALLNLNIEGNYAQALKELGFNLEELYEQELDAGLGNGGLGRLAACFLDSLASQNYIAWGYGIRYTYGMFRQEIFQGWQAEIPDLWLKFGNPWEITRFDVKYPVRFYGHCNGTHWDGGEVVFAVANDNPIPGFRTTNTINLRLWASEPMTEFDLASFNDGNYYKAIERRQQAETISSVLYPNDNSNEGKELRLKQQYFFCSATLQDVIRRFKKRSRASQKSASTPFQLDWTTFSDKVAVQLNDTHPTISCAELFRLLMDEEKLGWEEAAVIVGKTFAYTNHTVLPEALEKWSLPLFSRVLPRHLDIIFEINRRHMEQVSKRYPNNDRILRELSIIDENGAKAVRMAHLAIVCSHHVNGVAAIHSEIIKNELFKDFNDFYPGKFTNVTNGITPRRWFLNCNKPLVKLIANKLGDDSFLLNLDKLSLLRKYAADSAFQNEWMNVKLAAKKRLAQYLREYCNVDVDPSKALFDVHVKRIHEYKRQYLNILRVIYLYNDLRRRAVKNDLSNEVPKVVIFAGKAAPGYFRAKLVIKLINSVAERVNNDRSIKGLLKVAFMPNYNVSLAEVIIPASDVSQHISTAGTEASGTSNMKFALNGGLIIGTLDGANIEIRDEIGHENMFIFGLTADKVEDARREYRLKEKIEDSRLQETVNLIRSGEFGDAAYFGELCDALFPPKDFYLLGADFASYLDASKEVDRAYSNRSEWAKMSIMSTAGMGKFTSDRSIKDYAEQIWGVKPSPPPKESVRSATSSPADTR